MMLSLKTKLFSFLRSEQVKGWVKAGLRWAMDRLVPPN
mgnify:CR=1 FL=1